MKRKSRSKVNANKENDGDDGNKKRKKTKEEKEQLREVSLLIVRFAFGLTKFSVVYKGYILCTEREVAKRSHEG